MTKSERSSRSSSADVLGSEAPLRFGMARAGGVQQFDVEPAQQLGDAGADASQSHDSDHRAAQLPAQELVRLPAGPAPGAHEPLPLAQPPGRRQHQCHRQLGRRVREHVGRVGDDHAALAARCHIHVVVADREVGDHPQSRRRPRRAAPRRPGTVGSATSAAAPATLFRSSSRSASAPSSSTRSAPRAARVPPRAGSGRPRLADRASHALQVACRRKPVGYFNP